MLKRLIDIVFSAAGLIVFSPVLLTATLVIWLQDCRSPFYVAPRVGRDGKEFTMVKLRSMVVDADKAKVDSTSANDARITKVGVLIRAYKLDELSQLWNVFKGDMSMVGPRPNVKRETDLYTAEEQRLLSVKPGITDISSIVFSDEGEILKESVDPDIAYNQLIRPWTSRLGILYIENSSLWLDICIITLTAVAILSRRRALKGIQRMLAALNANEELRRVALRQDTLVPTPPPGSSQIVTSRQIRTAP